MNSRVLHQRNVFFLSGIVIQKVILLLLFVFMVSIGLVTTHADFTFGGIVRGLITQSTTDYVFGAGSMKPGEIFLEGIYVFNSATDNPDGTYNIGGQGGYPGYVPGFSLWVFERRSAWGPLPGTVTIQNGELYVLSCEFTSSINGIVATSFSLEYSKEAQVNYWSYREWNNEARGELILSNPTNVVVPEPSTYIAGFCILGIVGMSVWYNHK